MHLQLLANTVSAASTADSVDPRGQALSCAWVLTSGTSQNIPSCSGPQRVLAASPVARTPPQPWGEGREWALMLFHTTDPSPSAGRQSPVDTAAC